MVALTCGSNVISCYGWPIQEQITSAPVDVFEFSGIKWTVGRVFGAHVTVGASSQGRPTSPWAVESSGLFLQVNAN